MIATATLKSFETMSPLYIKQQAMYLLCLESYLAIILDGSKVEKVILATESCLWHAFSSEMTGKFDESIK
jgi:hypothetical protein